jgi:hypothetical protein
MENIQSTGDEADQGADAFKTTFASREQAASLIHALVLTPREIEQVSGGKWPVDDVVKISDFDFDITIPVLEKPKFPIPIPESCMPILRAITLK